MLLWRQCNGGGDDDDDDDDADDDDEVVVKMLPIISWTIICFEVLRLHRYFSSRNIKIESHTHWVDCLRIKHTCILLWHQCNGGGDDDDEDEEDEEEVVVRKMLSNISWTICCLEVLCL